MANRIARVAEGSVKMGTVRRAITAREMVMFAAAIAAEAGTSSRTIFFAVSVL